MPKFETTHRVNHSAQNMYDLVADIESYPKFVPLCSGLKIRDSKIKGNRAILLADMQVAYKLISEQFTSQVNLDGDKQIIHAKYIDGPFKYLDNMWRFEDVEGGVCDVHFSIDYEFKSRALGVLMGTMFDMAFRKFVTAFEARADEIYG
jgi:coenzyme Q-binding protein COQ10